MYRILRQPVYNFVLIIKIYTIMREKIEKRKHFINCNIAGFMYWDGCLVFNKLHVGTKLKLVRVADNRYDAVAVAIYLGDSKLGYIPRCHNEVISQFLDMGYYNIFEARINRICSDAHPESQVHINIYITQNKYHGTNN